jgi:23S rRNA (guanosine2251-2'-O)-methyltransferase
MAPNRKLKLWELNRVNDHDYKLQKKFPIIIVLDDIRSLSNVGSFFRTGDAFNVEKIILCGITAQPPHREIHKTALGATETVSWEYVKNATELIPILNSNGYEVCVIEQTENTTLLQDVNTFQTDRKFALFFGNEVDGVNQELVNMADHILEIPQFGTKHSLNVSVCAGIVLWEFVRRLI